MNFKKEWDDACLEKKKKEKKKPNTVKQQIMKLVESLSSLCVIRSSRLSGMGPGREKLKEGRGKKIRKSKPVRIK